MKQDCQLKITLHFLLAYLADQRNNDQKTALTNKIYGGGEYSKSVSYITFEKFITRLNLESTNIAQFHLLMLQLTQNQKTEVIEQVFPNRDNSIIFSQVMYYIN